LHKHIIQRLYYSCDPGVSHYKLTLGRSLFLKVYKGKKEDYTNEINNYKRITGIPDLNFCVPNKIAHFWIANRGFIAYEFIAFKTLDDIIQKEKVSVSTIREIIKQIPQFLQLNNLKDTKKYPFKLYCGLFDKRKLNKINKHLIKIIYQINTFSKATFGEVIFSDRNPRNILCKGITTIHVDFEVIRNSSQLFDLVKLIRNGQFFENNLKKLSSTKSYSKNKIVEHSRLFKSNTENGLVKYFFKQHGAKMSEEGKIYFQLACLLVHTFYLFIYIDRWTKFHNHALLDRAAYHYCEIYVMQDILNKQIKIIKDKHLECELTGFYSSLSPMLQQTTRLFYSNKNLSKSLSNKICW